MWTCNECGEVSEDQFDGCWNCGASRDSSAGDGAARSITDDEGIPSALPLPRSESYHFRRSVGVSYDPAVIKRLADSLYQRASAIVALYTTAGVLVGLMLGVSAGAFAVGAGVGGAFIGALAGAFIGWNIGSQKAFWLKLQAQIALCQVEIEANTRRL